MTDSTPPGLQNRLDDAIRSFYRATDAEDARIRSASTGGRIEFERMRRLIRAALPAGSRVLDVGGATGVHSSWLAQEGHRVTLVDPVAEQVRRAAAIGTFTAVLGDARALPVPDGSVDAVLLAGPLYHLIDRADRLRALSEARRALVDGGVVLAQGIGRLSALADEAASAGFENLRTEDLTVLRTGRWWDASGGFPAGHFHTAAELRGECQEAGFGDVLVHGVEGPHTGALDFIDVDPELVELGVRLAERAEELAGRGGAADRLADSCPHILAVGRR